MGHDFEKDARATQHASVAERVSQLEQLLKDSADSNDAMKGHHATLKEQLDELEVKLQSARESALKELESEIAREASTRQAEICELREFVEEATSRAAQLRAA